ncbi:MAG: exodeoxyribonuclease III [Desulfovibrio sp.]|nr:exodeoxyribonuclease III [Desulfovibrio sp.]
MKLKLVSWNVNGLRALFKKPQWDFFEKSGADILNLQETKAHPSQLPDELLTMPGWNAYWDSSVVKKGYSGVGVYTKLEPRAAIPELPNPEYKGEGRLLRLEYPEFYLFNGYFPNGGMEILDEDGKPTGGFKRLDYKMGFLNAFLDFAVESQKKKPVVVCGDFNIAHRSVDLSNPKANEKVTGFLPEERAWMDRFVDAGFIDTFRFVNGDVPDKYTWWSYKNRGRSRNVGWRLDYFFVSRALKDNIRDAWIESGIEGSDHCPVGLELEF